MNPFTLETLDQFLAERAKATPDQAYTAQLVHKGQSHAAKKLGEEAVETVIAAISGDRKALKNEAADLVYHLLVVLRIGGVSVQDVLGELERRTAQSGLAEKAARPKG